MILALTPIESETNKHTNMMNINMVKLENNTVYSPTTEAHNNEHGGPAWFDFFLRKKSNQEKQHHNHHRNDNTNNNTNNKAKKSPKRSARRHSTPAPSNKDSTSAAQKAKRQEHEKHHRSNSMVMVPRRPSIPTSIHPLDLLEIANNGDSASSTCDVDGVSVVSEVTLMTYSDERAEQVKEEFFQRLRLEQKELQKTSKGKQDDLTYEEKEALLNAIQAEQDHAIRKQKREKKKRQREQRRRQSQEKKEFFERLNALRYQKEVQESERRLSEANDDLDDEVLVPMDQVEELPTDHNSGMNDNNSDTSDKTPEKRKPGFAESRHLGASFLSVMTAKHSNSQRHLQVDEKKKNSQFNNDNHDRGRGNNENQLSNSLRAKLIKLYTPATNKSSVERSTTTASPEEQEVPVNFSPRASALSAFSAFSSHASSAYQATSSRGSSVYPSSSACHSSQESSSSSNQESEEKEVSSENDLREHRNYDEPRGPHKTDGKTVPSTNSKTKGGSVTSSVKSHINNIIELKMLVANQQATIDTLSSKLHNLELAQRSNPPPPPTPILSNNNSHNNDTNDEERSARRIRSLEAENRNLATRLNECREREISLRRELSSSSAYPSNTHCNTSHSTVLEGQNCQLKDENEELRRQLQELRGRCGLPASAAAAAAAAPASSPSPQNDVVADDPAMMHENSGNSHAHNNGGEEEGRPSLSSKPVRRNSSLMTQDTDMLTDVDSSAVPSDHPSSATASSADV